MAISWTLLEMALDRRLVDDWTAVVGLLIISLFAIVLLLGDPIRRFAGILWAFLLAYFGAAFVARYGFDLTYIPYVPDAVFNRTTLDAMRAFDLSYIVFFPLLREKWCRSCITAYTTSFARVAAIPRRRIFGVCAVLVAIGMLDWIEIARTGLGVIVDSARRTFSDDLILASNHNVQVVAIPITMLVLIYAWQTRDRLHRMVFIGCAAFAWLPSVLAGSRKEVFLICTALLPVILTRPVSATVRLLVIGVGFLFILIPIWFDGRIVMGFQEFILPFYNVVSIKEYSDYLRPMAPFYGGVQLLLPSFLRPMEVQVFGTEMMTLMTALGQHVSYGGQPYAEALAYAGQSPSLMFLASNSILVGTCIVLARINPVFTIIAFPYLAIWGRSILWVTLFFIVYGGLLLVLLTSHASPHSARMDRRNRTAVKRAFTGRS